MTTHDPIKEKPSFLGHAMRKRREFMECNTDWDEDNPVTDDDVFDDLDNDCGRVPGGGCTLAGTEYCDFECPFRD